ncbi:MAG: hypothetical protein M3506_02160 [Chloroflexota bacterium]|nr:hypothetical protein [Chloroflexota bacterium]
MSTVVPETGGGLTDNGHVGSLIAVQAIGGDLVVLLFGGVWSIAGG